MPTKKASIKEGRSKKSKSQKTSTKKPAKDKQAKKRSKIKEASGSILKAQKANKATKSKQNKSSKARDKASAKKGKTSRKYVKERVHYTDYSINVGEYKIDSFSEEGSEISGITEGESIEISGDVIESTVTCAEEAWGESAAYEQGVDAGEDDDDGTVWGGPQITGESEEGGNYE